MREADSCRGFVPVPQRPPIPQRECDQERPIRLGEFLKRTHIFHIVIRRARTPRILIGLNFIIERHQSWPAVSAEDFQYLWCQMSFPGPTTCLMLPLLWHPEHRALLLSPRRDRKDLVVFAEQVKPNLSKPLGVKLATLYCGSYARKIVFDFQDGYQRKIVFDLQH